MQQRLDALSTAAINDEPADEICNGQLLNSSEFDSENAAFQNETQLSDLPVEAQAQIINQLPLKDRLAFRRSCKNNRAIVDNVQLHNQRMRFVAQHGRTRVYEYLRKIEARGLNVNWRELTKIDPREFLDDSFQMSYEDVNREYSQKYSPVKLKISENETYPLRNNPANFSFNDRMFQLRRELLNHSPIDNGQLTSDEQSAVKIWQQLFAGKRPSYLARELGQATKNEFLCLSLQMDDDDGVYIALIMGANIEELSIDLLVLALKTNNVFLLDCILSQDNSFLSRCWDNDQFADALQFIGVMTTLCLLAHGLKINYSPLKNGKTLLHRAAGHYENRSLLIKLLLDFGIMPHRDCIADENDHIYGSESNVLFGMSPLLLAIRVDWANKDTIKTNIQALLNHANYNKAAALGECLRLIAEMKRSAREDMVGFGDQVYDQLLYALLIIAGHRLTYLLDYRDKLLIFHLLDDYPNRTVLQKVFDVNFAELIQNPEVIGRAIEDGITFSPDNARQVFEMILRCSTYQFAMRKFLAQCAIDVNQPIAGVHPLAIAAISNDLNVVKQLLLANANVNLLDPRQVSAVPMLKFAADFINLFKLLQENRNQSFATTVKNFFSTNLSLFGQRPMTASSSPANKELFITSELSRLLNVDNEFFKELTLFAIASRAPIYELTISDVDKNAFLKKLCELYTHGQAGFELIAAIYLVSDDFSPLMDESKHLIADIYERQLHQPSLAAQAAR